MARFTARMKQVDAHLNSPDFRAAGGRGLDGLARFFWRCDEVVRLEGERVLKSDHTLRRLRPSRWSQLNSGLWHGGKTKLKAVARRQGRGN